jgi:hypothetical protein
MSTTDLLALEIGRHFDGIFTAKLLALASINFAPKRNTARVVGPNGSWFFPSFANGASGTSLTPFC